MPENNEVISDSKIYDIVINMKAHTEIRRDEVNKHYTSLFTVIISAMPFIEKFSGGSLAIGSGPFIRILLPLLSAIGFILSISWVLTLKRISNCIDGFDKLLISIEEKHKKSLVIFISTYLKQTHSPDRITKQEMLMPYTFMIILFIALITSIYLFIKGLYK